MVFICFIIILLYLILIGCFVFGFDKVKAFYLQDIESKTTFTVIIPFRNESENLPELLEAMASLKYPKHLYEIIFVDDDSDDGSIRIINKVLDTKFSNENSTRTDIKIIKNERLTNSPKKDAITTAINHSKHEWIITTDADCILPKYCWRASMNLYRPQIANVWLLP